ncbi:T9SS type A sorting domain-containing protein [Winogradskyella sp. HB-48]|uniref:T9SS type A sorting domain-containing protein n=1 Tax=Winogradskyella sp. HB-48 TaxID=3416808 RepID=UPI003CF1673F
MKSSHYSIFTFTFLFLFVHIKTHVKDSRNFENRNYEITSGLEVNEITSLGQLRLSLYESSALANNESAADGVLILFDTNGNNGIDASDAPDIPNLDENFSINNNGVLLSIETRAAPVDQEEIQLEVNTYRSINYTIVSEGISMQYAIAFLYDNFTGTSTEIPQNGIINYDYSINSGIPESVAGNRFKIVFDVETLSNNVSDLEGISLYPNPTNLGKFFINIPLGMDDLNVSIYNILGSKLYSGNGYASGSTITIVVDDMLNAGTYFIEFSSQGKNMVKKLVVF